MFIAALRTNLSDFFLYKNKLISIQANAFDQKIACKRVAILCQPQFWTSVLYIYKSVKSYNCTCKEVNNLPQSFDVNCLLNESLYL